MPNPASKATAGWSLMEMNRRQARFLRMARVLSGQRQYARVVCILGAGAAMRPQCADTLQRRSGEQSLSDAFKGVFAQNDIR